MLPVEKLRALYWAEIHMREAKEACIHMLSLDATARHEVRHCIYTGIVVSYARSFGENQGLSALGKEFRRFDDPKMQKLHDALLETRDTIYAHKDVRREGDRLSPEIRKDELQTIRIDIAESGESHWMVNRSFLPEDYLNDIAALCDFQMARMNQASRAMLFHFCRSKQYLPGRYVLGENFP